MDHLRKLHMICLTIDELLNLFRKARLKDLERVLDEKGYELVDLHHDSGKMHEVADSIVEENLRYKEEIEIFAALEACLNFYPKESKICFALKDNINPKQYDFSSLENLKNATKENELTDFAIFSEDGLRQFQLKQFQEILSNDSLFAFIEKKLKAYGNNLGEVNLLIQLQGPKKDRGIVQQMSIDFEKLHEQILGMNLKFSGQILIQYNENNKFTVIHQVYPELRSKQIEMDSDYLAGKDFYQ